MQAQATKVCTKCGLSRCLDDFFLVGGGRPGHRSVCKPCAAEYQRQNRREYRIAYNAAHADQINARTSAYQKRPEVLARILQRVKRQRRLNPEPFRIQCRASRAVQRAIKRGILTRPTVCEECGKDGTIQAAHYDYDRPLDVRWLCPRCHYRWDHAEPKLNWH